MFCSVRLQAHKFNRPSRINANDIKYVHLRQPRYVYSTKEDTFTRFIYDISFTKTKNAHKTWQRQELTEVY